MCLSHLQVVLDGNAPRDSQTESIHCSVGGEEVDTVYVAYTHSPSYLPPLLLVRVTRLYWRSLPETLLSAGNVQPVQCFDRVVHSSLVNPC